MASCLRSQFQSICSSSALDPTSPTRHCQADPLGRTPQVGVPADHHDVPLAKLQGADEMDGVIAAKLELFGELARPADEVLVDSDRDQLAREVLELRQRSRVCRLRQASVLAPRMG
ncbi:MAG TPA: hypothetical protein VF245_00430 [Solirubrobacterales bacterium]